MINQFNQSPNQFFFWDKQFLDEKNLIANIPSITLPELIEHLNEIDSIAVVNNPDISKLQSLWYDLVIRFPITLVEVDIPYVIRCRPNDDPNKPIFKNISEISYNPNANAGRFNIASEPLFYCSLPIQREDEIIKEGEITAEACALFETCKDLKASDLKENKYFTLGYWRVRSKFFAIVLFFYDEAIKNNKHFRKMYEYFTSVINEKFTAPTQEMLKYLYEYLSVKAGSIYENQNDYLITTAFRKALEQYYGTNIKGLLYSSSMTDNKGMNLVITKDMIDDKHIEFGQAIIYRISTNKKVEPITDFVSADTNGNLNFGISTLN